MFNLEGKTALITGASGGIGAEIARALHAQGADVVLHGTRQAKLEELAASLGSRAHVVTANLSDKADVEGLFAKASEFTGAVNILVNNAGITRDNLAMRDEG